MTTHFMSLFKLMQKGQFFPVQAVKAYRGRRDNTNRIYTKIVKNQIKIFRFNVIFVCCWLTYILQF